MALLAAAMAVSAVVLLVLETHITFFLDDWAVLLHRRGLSADVILDPNNQHPAMVPVLIYKALLATFGMDSARPFQVIEVLSFLLADALLFIWIRRRVGAWLALAAVVPVLFLGSAYEDLLWQFQVGYFGSMACGLGMLLALDRDDPIGDRWACALLAASMTFSSVGLAFLVPAAVYVAWDERRRRRAYVVLIPAALYALWWLGWGHTAQSTRRDQEHRHERELRHRRALLEHRLAARPRDLPGGRVAHPARLGAAAAARGRRGCRMEGGPHSPDPSIAGRRRLARARLLVLGGRQHRRWRERRPRPAISTSEP